MSFSFGDVKVVFGEVIAVRFILDWGIGVKCRCCDHQHSRRIAIKVILFDDQARNTAPCQFRTKKPSLRRTQV